MSNSVIEFDAALHRYTVDGIVRPSVTQILSAAGIIDNEWYTDEARDRGSAVHAACHYADENDLDQSWRDNSPYVGYLNAWEKFKAESAFETDLIEARLFHAKLGYCGSLDRTGRIAKSKLLPDIKTGQHEAWHPIQGAAYAACLPEPATYRRANVYLRKDGTYRFVEYRCADYFKDFAVFQSAIGIYNFKKERGSIQDAHSRNAADRTAA